MEDNLLIDYNGVDVERKEFTVLKNVDFKLYSGEFVYFIGLVGSGKSSLLKTFYAEIPVTTGSARVLDYDMLALKKRDIPMLRRKIGIVFQDFQLLIDRSVGANLEFVLRATGWKDKGEINDRVEEVLSKVGMQTKAYKMPHELSGGEQQRIVIARALLNSPKLILADEPTGNLDPQTGNKIAELLHEICSTGTSVIMTTHNHNIIQDYPGRVIKFEDKHINEAFFINKNGNETNTENL
ncbi:MAG: ATP-binding cassette domain-containing protein [Bacteroidetes bacterium]|uniref:Cell division ATP-binding protein FtsE n=1 Tax=Candidatus Caccoplasma merdipullorum TaxID=2840718 RepID=A0A9D9E5Q1_9BACT|nr:ATP-binding cassette domain-containing protein [Candidatus Caccoplasma merdipullorum]